ncbi:MAG: type II CRISPR-associated endonuclease Cas1 [Paludibacter sp.]|nr:type II CRISPR-associated endonuclease Cas1 [Bacteroidales bacterium]MCM1069969.1 type II CRISPR-associated endonuclease Cas1 [Prevotella sp.]MCM1354642.1 type II CRISPR-associated endonuclease Cas1 [Bacteroides sp.]MCM1443583.1 type II CRISPR-associated endonuclease Cas1 [Muribaculum sp.]MCM1482499.1 type II CRISPR-associated endonuclease Cas1 [Paludibacter sp.]
MIKRTICFSKPAYLSLKQRQLLIRYPEVVNQPAVPQHLKEEAQITLPIEDIGVVVLDNRQITLTQGLMAALLENNCAIVFCNEQHLPIGLQLPLCGNSVQNERFRAQIEASLPLRKQLWQQTVQQKIANQAAVLRCVGAEYHNMQAWVQNVRSGDADNLEGRAAAYYWRNIFPSLPDFIRGQDEMPPNNLLNYGYAILRALVARALVAAGLLPTLGIHHHNRYNAYCLADDLMEPYRPYVDKEIIRIMQTGVDYTNITTDLKRELLNLPVVDVAINGVTSPLMVAVQTTAYSLCKCFNGEARKIVYPDLNESV